MRMKPLAAVLALSMLVLPSAAPAQDKPKETKAPAASQEATKDGAYPDRSVRLLIAFSAGGTLDVLGRLIAQKLQEMWGQGVVVENRPGGAGNIGAQAASQAAPDGYTLHLGAQSLAVNVTLQPAKFDPVRDFEPIMLVGTAQDILLVGQQSPFKSLKDLIAFAKSNPGKLTYGTINLGTNSHLSMTSFMNATGINVRMVPYTQSSQMSGDVMTGRVDMQFPTTGGHIGNVQSGKLRALAVSGPERAKLLPDVPTLRESGIVFEDESSWYGLFAPKGTPRAIVDKINRDMQKVLAMPDLRQRTDQLGFRLIGGTPEELHDHLKRDIKRWAEASRTPAFLGK